MTYHPPLVTDDDDNDHGDNNDNGDDKDNGDNDDDDDRPFYNQRPGKLIYRSVSLMTMMVGMIITMMIILSSAREPENLFRAVGY